MDLQLLFIAIAPGIALSLGIYLNDRYDKEPVDLLFKVFLLGCLSIIPTIIVERILSRFNIFTGLLWPLYTSFVVAGFTEELFKRGAVLMSAFKSPYFNEKLDGIVYCAFSALGFATIENISYVVFRYPTNPYIGVSRALLSVPAHMLFAVTMGYYLSLAKYCELEPGKCREYMRKSLIMPIILHGIFDFILLSNLPFLMFIFIPYVLYLWKINLSRLNEYTKDSRDRFSRINRRGREEF